MATLRDLTKQMLIVERGGSPSHANLASIRSTYLRCVETWPASMKVAAALVANDHSFSVPTVDALDETNAP